MKTTTVMIFWFTIFISKAYAGKVPAAFTPVLKVPSRSSSIHGQIIAGKLATLGQFPWQASLLIYVGSSTYICGAELVNKNWILTAAHCVYGASKVRIRLGSIDYNNGGTVYTVYSTSIKRHQNYNSNTLKNDIALIKIPTTNNTNTIKSITILPLNITSFSGNLTVSGFGKTCDANTNTCSPGKMLNYVNVVPISNAECQNIYGSTVVTANTICTSGFNGGKESTCGGDSGGPLALIGNPNYLVGVVSFGAAAGCEKKLPAGFTRANMYCDWMKNMTGVVIC